MRPVNLGAPIGKSQDQINTWIIKALRQIEQASSDTLINDTSSSGNALATVSGAAADEIAYFTGATSTAFTALTGTGRAVIGSANAAAFTAQVNLFTSTLSGAVPGSGGGSANFLRADGTWAVPAGTGVTSISQGTGMNFSVNPIVATGTINLGSISDQQVLGNISGGSAAPVGLTKAQLTALINAATTSLSGAVPAWPNNTTTFFRGDGTYAAPAIAFSQQFTSSQQTYTNGTTITLAHGLGVIPDNIQIFAVNTSTEGGYSVGQYLAIAPYTIGVALDATNIVATPASSGLIAENTSGTGFTLSTSKWKLVFVASA